MNLSEEVSHVIQASTQALYFLLKFVEDMGVYIEQKKHPSSVDGVLGDMSQAGRSEFGKLLHEFADFMTDVMSYAEEIGKKGTVSFHFKPKKKYSEQAYRYLLPVMVSAAKPILYPEYLYNMALTHAVAILEAFLGDFLVAIFTHRTKTVKSEHTASYEEILSFTSMKALTEHLAVTRVKKILNENIDDVAEALQKLFSIDVSKCNDFGVIREAFYRRHVVVHSKGIADKKYCERLHSSQLGVELSTDHDYLATLFAAIG